MKPFSTPSSIHYLKQHQTAISLYEELIEEIKEEEDYVYKNFIHAYQEYNDFFKALSYKEESCLLFDEILIEKETSLSDEASLHLQSLLATLAASHQTELFQDYLTDLSILQILKKTAEKKADQINKKLAELYTPPSNATPLSAAIPLLYNLLHSSSTPPSPEHNVVSSIKRLHQLSRKTY